MSNTFNSKFAKPGDPDDIYDLGGITGEYVEGGGAPEGFSIIDPGYNSWLQEPPTIETGFSDAMPEDVPKPEKSKTFRPKEVDERGIRIDERFYAPNADLQTWSPDTRFISDPEKKEKARKSWALKIQERSRKIKIDRLMRPDKYEEKDQKRAYREEANYRRNLMGAVYAFIAKTPRMSMAYQCRDCGGDIHGGKPVVDTTPPIGTKQRMIKCVGCNNNGSSLSEPHRTVFNLRSSIAAFNAWKDFHNRICVPAKCHDKCIFKKEIDEKVRGDVIDPSSLTWEDTHNKSGRSDTYIGRLLRKEALIDDFKPIAHKLKMLSGREDEPIRKYDVCHFANFDPINPDGNIVDRTDPAYTKANEHVFNALGGVRDKQAFAVVIGTSSDGRSQDIIYSGRPVSAVRAERIQRRKGKKGSRDIQFNSSDEAANIILENRPQNESEDARKMRISRRAVRQQMVNAYDRVKDFMGERSPLRGERFYKVLRNVPTEFLQRVDDNAAAMITYSGRVKQARLPNGVKIEGWYTGPALGNRGFKKETASTADLVCRMGTGFSQEEMQEGIQGKIDQETYDAWHRLDEDSARDLGIKPETERYRETSLVDKPRSNTTLIGEPPSITKNLSADDVSNITKSTPVISEETFGNEEPINIGESQAELPHGTLVRSGPDVEAPPTVEDLLSTPDGRQSIVEQVKAQHPDPASLTNADKQDALDVLGNGGDMQEIFRRLGLEG